MGRELSVLIFLALIIGASGFALIKGKSSLTPDGWMNCLAADGSPPPSEENDDGPEKVVWSGEKNTGKTWATLGPSGGITFPANSGMNGGTALTITMDGKEYRGCGLNWKGWFPEDACDNATRFNALVFYIRQLTHVPDADLTVHLVDNLPRAMGSHASNGLRVRVDGGVEMIGGEWQKVVMPLDRFAQNMPLKRDKLWGIDFSNVGKDHLVFQIDRITLTNDKAARPKFPKHAGYTATVKVDTAHPGHEIKDTIYGVCGLGRDKLAEYGVPLTRWGGNTSSRYNWKINADNGAADWFFKNRGEPICDPEDNGYVRTIRANKEFGGSAYITIPTLGWVAKDNSSYSFPIRKYGEQKSTEPGHGDVGNGIAKNDRVIDKSDATDTSIAADPNFVAEAVQVALRRAGKACEGGVRYWVLDNEPMLWHKTHRDVRSDPLGYDELWERTVCYAEAIKKADPTAKVAGFCSWGWNDLFYSAKDEGNDHYASKPDYRAHGQEPLAAWFIRKCGEYKQKNGKPLVDVFDFHWYPQAEVMRETPYNGKGMDVRLNELRLRSTRDLWDPQYAQESWIARSGDGKPTALFRRIHEWVDKYNPGMEISLGEYNFGGGDNVTGGLAQADVFGILAQERADLAFIWHTPEGWQNCAWQLFRNYDGKGGRFGNRFLSSTSDQRNLSIYAAKRDKDGATTVVLINKDLGGPCEVKLEMPGVAGKVRIWRFDQENEQVVEIETSGVEAKGGVRLTVPAASASMVVITP